MNTLDLLLGRVSVGQLMEPGPNPEQQALLFQAALRAPDHARLQPWRFLTIEGESRQQLGEVFVRALLARNEAAGQEAVSRAHAMPLRAPLLIAVIACVREHPKVPAQEQILAAGCAAHNILLAAHAQGFGAIWRTGEFAYDALVGEALGLDGREEIIGFLYVGTPRSVPVRSARLQAESFVRSWSAGVSGGQSHG